MQTQGRWGWLAFWILSPLIAAAASHPHVIGFGKTMPVKWLTGASEDKAQELKVRPLYVDSKLREYTLGETHEVTDRLFVVRRAYRINDLLPNESKSTKWLWQRGGWLMVDRLTGHISVLKLAEFDPYYSATSWYRDLAAYCGVSSDGEKAYAMVVQIGRKKPLVRKPLGAAHGSDAPDSECPAPQWQRQPARVTFAPQGSVPLNYTIPGNASGVALPVESAEGESESKDENN